MDGEVVLWKTWIQTWRFVSSMVINISQCVSPPSRGADIGLLSSAEDMGRKLRFQMSWFDLGKATRPASDVLVDVFPKLALGRAAVPGPTLLHFVSCW